MIMFLFIYYNSFINTYIAVLSIQCKKTIYLHPHFPLIPTTKYYNYYHNITITILYHSSYSCYYILLLHITTVLVHISTSTTVQLHTGITISTTVYYSISTTTNVCIFFIILIVYMNINLFIQ